MADNGSTPYGPGYLGAPTGQEGDLLKRAFRPLADPLKTPADPMVVYRDIPIAVVSNWTPDLITSALGLHMNGQFQASARLVEAVMGDARVQATLLARTQSLFGQPVRFKPADDSSEAKACLDAWRDVWPRVAPMAVLSQTLRWGALMGFGLCEIVWDTSGGELWVPYLKPWNPQYLYYNLISRHYIAVSYDSTIEVEPGNGKWMLYAPFGAYRGWVNGAVRAVAIPWLIRQFALRDWARYSEVHGMPILKGIVPASGDAEQKKRFIQALSVIGQETAVTLPQGVDGHSYDLQLLEASAGNFQAFDQLIERCDTGIVLALLGQNLTTEVKEGSFAAARVHGDVRQNVLEGDCESLTLDIQEQLARPFALYNFGDAALAPLTTWDIDPVEDTDVRSQSLLRHAQAIRLLVDSGVQIDIEKLARQMRLPLKSPELKPPAAGAAEGGIGPTSGGGAGEPQVR
jgi:phage gp29-like protein